MVIRVTYVAVWIAADDEAGIVKIVALAADSVVDLAGKSTSLQAFCANAKRSFAMVTDPSTRDLALETLRPGWCNSL